MTMRIQEPDVGVTTQSVKTPDEASAVIVAGITANIGTPASAAATSDTAVADQTSLFKWYLQRFTILLGRLPTALGPGVKTGALLVTNATNDPLVVATGLAADSSVASDADATGTFFGWAKWISSRLTAANTALGTVNAALASIIADTGAVGVAPDSNRIYIGTTAATPKFAKIAASSSGDNTLVAAVTAKKIRVLSYNLTSSGVVNAKFQSGASGTDITGLKYMAAAGGGIAPPAVPWGCFETAAGALLNLNLSAGVAVGGELTYVEV